MVELTPQRRANLIRRTLDELALSPFRSPASNEGETRFTRTVLAPAVRNMLKSLEFPGLISTGDGAASVKHAHCIGSQFYPDLAVEFFGEPVLAVEVKFLRELGRQNSIATAIGQAAIYRQRYPATAVLLIDTVPRVHGDEISTARDFMEKTFGIELIVRLRSGAQL